MIRRPIPIEVFTTLHRISGKLQANAPGIFSFLNLPTESGVDIDDALLAPLLQPWEQAEKVGSIWLVKSEIAVVVVGSRGDVGPTGTTRGGYTKPFPHRVRILLAGYELRGLIESAGKLDFGGLVFDTDSPFIAMYDVQLRAVLFPRVTLESPAVLINRKLVTAITLQHRKETQPLGTPPESDRHGE